MSLSGVSNSARYVGVTGKSTSWRATDIFIHDKMQAILNERLKMKKKHDMNVCRVYLLSLNIIIVS